MYYCLYIYVCIYHIGHISGMLQGIGVRPILLTTLTIIWLEHSNIFYIVPLAGAIRSAPQAWRICHFNEDPLYDYIIIINLCII